MNILFAEHAYQAEDLLKHVGGRRDKWIALGPSAMYFLQHKQIPYDIPEDYCPREEVEEVCVNRFERLTDACGNLDSILLEREPFLKEWDIHPFLLHLWQLGMIVDALAARTMQLEKILAHFPGKKAYVHLAPKKPWAIFGIGFAKDETLWGRLLALPGWKNDVVTLPEPSGGPEKGGYQSLMEILKDSSRKKAVRLLKSSPELATIVYSFNNGIPTNGFKVLLPFFGRKYSSALVLGHPHDWRYVLPSLSGSGILFWFLKDLLLHNDAVLHKESTRGPETDELVEAFRCGIAPGGIDYTRMIEERVRWIITQGPAAARIVIQRTARMVLAKNIRLLINSSTVSFHNNLVKHYFIKKNIPVLVWQHGAMWYDRRITQRYDLYDMLTNSIVLTYGDGSKRAYEKSKLKASCSIESVGSISLDRLKVRRPAPVNHNLRVLYVITNYYRNGWYCGFSPPFSDCIYYYEQSVIVKRMRDVVRTRYNVSLTVKLHPGADILDEDPPWTEDLKNSDRIDLTRQPSFVELLDEHDAVIVDSPTTTLLQAVATRLLVFVLTSVVSPPRSDLQALKKRALCASSAARLMDLLEAYLDTGQYRADVTNRDFLKLYGTYLDDGMSHLRAESIVKRALS